VVNDAKARASNGYSAAGSLTISTLGVIEMADKSYRNVILLDTYRGLGPRGWKVWPNGGCHVIEEETVRKDAGNRTLSFGQTQKTTETQS
jgi:hypothetical protein